MPTTDQVYRTRPARHYDEPALAALTDVWNRLNVTTRQVAGSVPG